MGTRHLVIVKVDKKVKVAQYGQWDGYLDGQGRDIADFLQKDYNPEKLKDNVKKLKWATKKHIENCWQDAGAEKNAEFVNMVVSKKFDTMYPHLSRDCGAQILNLIQDGVYEKNDHEYVKDDLIKKEVKYSGYKVDKVKNDLGFLKDGAFCEYAYELDLDNETITVYKNGNKKFGSWSFKEWTPELINYLTKTNNNVE